MQFVKPTSHVRPATREQDDIVGALRFGQAIVGGIAVDRKRVGVAVQFWA